LKWPRSKATAQAGAALKAGNFGRGRQARKSKSGRTSAIRRGPWKAVVGAGGEGRLHGVRRKTRGKLKLRRVSSRARP